ncbi:MAG TPA: aminotransferase class IV [Alphaproteobacteria bacterium]|nr:aminotransferase class IV [Alphaproteobacteria bacterium]
MIFSVNGKLVAPDEARIDPGDRGFTLGDGLYETIRVRNGAPLRLERHFDRLARGLALLGLPPVDPASIGDSIRAVLTANALEEAAVRITVSRGPAARGIAPEPDPRPTIVIGVSPYLAPAPVSLITATVTRRNEHSPLSRVKSTNCLDAILARIEASDRGAGEALLLNTAGRVAEATIANLFAVVDGALLTPPIADGALPGIMRGAVIEGMGAREQSLTPSDLAGAEELFLTSSLGIRPVTILDGRPLRRGRAGAQATMLA